MTSTPAQTAPCCDATSRQGEGEGEAASSVVSVLVTCYNRERYVGAALESVLAQSFADWELVVVDDGSTDRSPAIIADYAARDARIRSCPNPRNLGQFETRNRVAALARGKYLKYLDSDDFLHPHCLADMIHMMERHPEAGLLATVWSDAEPFYPFVHSPEETYRRHFVFGERFCNSPLTTMMRRSVFQAVGGFDPAYPLSGDYDLLLRMAARTPTLFAPTGFSFYRVHDGQVVSTQTDEIWNFTTEGNRIALAALRSPQCPLSAPERLWARSRVLRLGLRYIAGLATKKRRPLPAWHLLRFLRPGIAEIPALLHRRPVVPRPAVPEAPDWTEFPDAASAGVAAKLGSLPSVEVLLCGENAELADWCRTLDSIRAQWLLPSVSVVLLPSQRQLAEPLVARFPGVRVSVSDQTDPWVVRNAWTREATGELLKFAEPGVLFYPYALFLEAGSLARFPEALCGAAGNYGPTLYPVLLSPGQAVEYDRTPGMCAFRMPLPCILFRRAAFADGGFDPGDGARASVGLMRRCVAAGGLVAFHEGLCSAHRGSSFLDPQGAR